jgi:hypothetical protein
MKPIFHVIPDLIRDLTANLDKIPDQVRDDIVMNK